MCRLRFAAWSPSRLRHKERGLGNNESPLAFRVLGSLSCALVATAIPCSALACPAVYPVDECHQVSVGGGPYDTRCGGIAAEFKNATGRYMR